MDESRGLQVLQLGAAQDKVRARYRAVARRMIYDWDAPDPFERLLSLRSALFLVAGGAWDQTEKDWRPLVLDGVDRLRIEEAGEEYQSAAASLALLALSVVKNTLSVGSPRFVERQYERTVERTADMLIEADEDRITEYADGLTQRFPGSARATTALDLLERLTTADVVANAIDDLNGAGVVARYRGRVIDLDEKVSNPLLAALMALAVVETIDLVAIRCAGSDDRFVDVLWRPPDLVVIESPRAGVVMSRRYEYIAGNRPGDNVRMERRLDPNRLVATTSVKEALPQIATEILKLVGMRAPAPPGMPGGLASQV